LSYRLHPDAETEHLETAEANRGIPRSSLLQVLSKWDPLDDEFPDIDDFEPIEAVPL
jgi:hypothetical protein